MSISVVEVIRDLRERAGLTQEELARRAGTSQPAVARLESGEAAPNLATLERLAQAADCELEVRIVPRVTPDPVIARYQEDIDRTLIRRNLGLTVDQRIRELAQLQEFHAELERSVRKRKRR
ncbi:MAG: helix-turn-helix transcriptional regulator [Gemmatimonadales bacterium]